MFRVTAKWNVGRWITRMISTSTGIKGVWLAQHKWEWEWEWWPIIFIVFSKQCLVEKILWRFQKKFIGNYYFLIISGDCWTAGAGFEDGRILVAGYFANLAALVIAVFLARSNCLKPPSYTGYSIVRLVCFTRLQTRALRASRSLRSVFSFRCIVREMTRSRFVFSSKTHIFYVANVRRQWPSGGNCPDKPACDAKTKNGPSVTHVCSFFSHSRRG